MLCLGCSENHKPAVISKSPEPAGDVSGLVLDDRVGNSGFGAKVSASHFRDQFFLAINGGAKLGGLCDALTRESLSVPCAVDGLVKNR
jgi:hypothetical protein